MPIITKITTQKKQTNRYNVFLDGEYALSVDEDVLVRFHLKKGQEITELDLTQIQYEDDIRKALNQAIQYLSFRMRSEKEVREHLEKKEWNDTIGDVVIKQLRDRNYCNDLEFAKAFVKTHVNGGKKGPQVIQRELKQKGIHDDLIKEAMLLYNEEDRLTSAIQLGQKVVQQNKQLSERLLKQKLEQFLYQKGFSYDTISIAMEDIAFEKDEEEEWESLKKLGEKFHRKYHHLEGFEYKQKMKQALYRKGFPLDLIERFLDEKEG